MNWTWKSPKDVRKAIEPYHRDALRYRWLRHGDNDEWVIKLMGYSRTPYLLRNEQLDAAIDDLMEKKMRIITANVRPPIPDFRWDWQATWDGWELGDPVGYGESEQEAIDNFKEIVMEKQK